MKIVISGHKGFIGGTLYKALENLSFDVRGVDLLEGEDILSCELPDADIVVHCAAVSDVVGSVAEPFKTAETNVAGTVRMAHRYKDKRFIFLSSGGAIQDTVESPYGLSKHCAEQFIKLICTDPVILRLANVYGAKNSRSVIDKFLNDEDIYIYGDGGQRRSYIHVDDVVKAIIGAFFWENGVYNISNDSDTLTVNEVAALCGVYPVRRPKRKGELRDGSVKSSTDMEPVWSASVSLESYLQSQRGE